MGYSLHWVDERFGNALLLTAECEMEGKALLAGPAVRVLDNTEVGMVGVLVVYRGDVELPTRHHEQVQVWISQVIGRMLKSIPIMKTAKGF